MKGRFDKPLILGRLRPSELLTSILALSQCAAMRGGTVFQWAGRGEFRVHVLAALTCNWRF